MRSRNRIALFALFIPAGLAACASSGNSYGAGAAATPAASVTTSAAKPALAVKHATLGKILVDSSGRTLYMFGRDRTDLSRCSGACATNWPPALSSKNPKAGGGITKAKLRVIRRSNGAMQLSYVGHPLYRFIADTKPGQTNGQGLNAFGGIWHVVSPAGAAITGSSSSAPPAQTSPAPMGGPYNSGGY